MVGEPLKCSPCETYPSIVPSSFQVVIFQFHPRRGGAPSRSYKCSESQTFHSISAVHLLAC